MSAARDDEYFIDLTDAAGPSLCGERIVFDLPWLSARLGGAPRFVPSPGPEPDGSASRLAVWDDMGVAARVEGDRVLPQLDVYFFSAAETGDGSDRRPRSAFPGYPSIDEADPVDVAVEEDPSVLGHSLDFMRGDWEASLRIAHSPGDYFENGLLKWMHPHEVLDRLAEADMPFTSLALTTSAATIRRARARLQEISRRKPLRPEPEHDWTLPAANGDELVFDTFEFKLAVLEELMFVQGRLQPAFDIEDFALGLGAGFDLDDHTCAVPPEVRDWITAYPVPAAQAPLVTALSLHVGNEIYGQAAWQWDGEDDLFEIAEITDRELAQFPALREISDPFELIGEAGRATLSARGIAVTDRDE